MKQDEFYMNEALIEAKKCLSIDEVPVGAIIVKDDKIIARSHNLRETKQNSLYHAEINTINQACDVLKTWRLNDCTMYVTLEPCPMCAGAIVQSRIKKVVFGTTDPKSGSIVSCTNLFDNYFYNHRPKYKFGILEKQCAEILINYFKGKRKDK